MGLGSMALASLLNGDSLADTSDTEPLAPRSGHFPAKAKAVIFLFMAGGPSHLELFDPKPTLQRLDGQTVPDRSRPGGASRSFGPTPSCSARGGASAKGGPGRRRRQRMLPFHREIVDDICIFKGMKTDVFNHGPAKVLLNTGSPQFGRPSMGSWITWGIGSESQNLPAFCCPAVRPARPTRRVGDLVERISAHALRRHAVPARPQPILDLQDAARHSARSSKPQFIDAVRDLNRMRLEQPAIPKSRRASTPTRRRSACRPPPPRSSNLSGETQETLEPLRRRAGPAVVRRQLPAGPPAGRTRRALRPAHSTPTGTIMARS